VCLVFGVLCMLKDGFVKHVSKPTDHQDNNNENLGIGVEGDEIVQMQDLNGSSCDIETAVQDDGEGIVLSPRVIRSDDTTEFNKLMTWLVQCRTLYILRNRMPWPIVPFVMSMFVMVSGFRSTGWIGLLTPMFVTLATLPPNIATIAITFVSAFACILLNNQPMTIFMTELLMDPAFRCQVSGFQLDIASYSLVLGSNLGGNLALNAALAGLMWQSLLLSKDITSITYTSFLFDGVLIAVPAIVLSSVSLSGVLVPY
jgi:hypothetical protein